MFTKPLIVFTKSLIVFTKPLIAFTKRFSGNYIGIAVETMPFFIERKVGIEFWARHPP